MVGASVTRAATWVRLLPLLALYGLAYAGCYWLSVHFSLVPPGSGGIAILWLPSGLQAAALLLVADRRLWPLVLATGLGAELLSGWWLFGPLNHVSLVAAVGNAGEALLCAEVVRRVGGHAVPTFHRSREVMALGMGAVLATAANAGFMDHWVDFRTYWVGDLTGVITLVPVLVCGAAEWRNLRAGRPVLRRGATELALLLVVALGVLALVFGRQDLAVADAGTVALLWPVVAWSAFRLGPSTTAGLGFAVIVVADLYPRAGRGPYGDVAESASARVAALQGFLCVLVLSSLALAAGLLEREQAESALAQVGERDAVTGLPSLDAARRTIERLRPAGSMTAVLVIDVDGFRDLNERLGREVGDEVLRQVGERLRVPLRTEDVVARMGDDTFLLVIGRLASVAGAQVTAERVLATLTAPIVAGQHVLAVSACSGLAVMEPRESADRVLSRAVAAVEQAKRGGPGRSQSLDTEAYGRLDEARRLQAQLRRAINDGQLLLHYQPIVDVRDGRLVAVESLVRWQHPDKGLLTAGHFVPGAEATGLVVALDDWVLAQALTDLVRLRTLPGLDELTLFVNISARTLAEPDSSERIRRALQAHGAAPTSVVIEVTETALVDDSETGRRAAAELAGSGVSLAIDDFGQGHASLARLRALPISVVKIDRSFVSGMGTHEIDDAVVRWVTQLAHQLRMSTVAEGVERPEQLTRLAAIGVDFAQGFGIARPMPVEELRVRVSADGSLVVPTPT
jgi:diguanylate cyclase (GGDEF)-like protein